MFPGRYRFRHPTPYRKLWHKLNPTEEAEAVNLSFPMLKWVGWSNVEQVRRLPVLRRRGNGTLPDGHTGPKTPAQQARSTPGPKGGGRAGPGPHAVRKVTGITRDEGVQ